MTLATYCLQPPLSSSRNYVFGADLFDALVTATSAQAPASLRLTLLTNEALDLHHDTPQPDNPNFAGSFTYKTNDQELLCWMTRRPGDIITLRSDEQDRSLLADVYLREDGADSATAGEASISKAALVLTVLWLVQAYPTLVWNLAKLRVDGPFRGSGELRVTRSRQIGRFLQIHVWFQDQAWGEIMLASSPYIEQTGHD